MSSPAPKAPELELLPPRPASRQGPATVVGERDGAWLLAGDEGEFEARRAASCLLEPALGDEVWFVGRVDRGHFVTAVLERAASDSPARLRVDGDAELAAGGHLRVEGEAGLELATKQRLDLSSDELRVRARLGQVILDECSLVLRKLLSHVTRGTYVGKVLETLVDRVRQHSKTSYRSVAEIDQVQAGVIDHRASASAQLHGKQTLITGEELVKADGGQIHIG
jgi:hypothetical protein